MDRRNAPNSFVMWFREHDRVFDWGRLRWCQMLPAPADGCFDVENIALDEFGHVQILDHHLNHPNQSDFEDAVVQTVSRARPKPGWNVHAYGRCDVATLQIKYDMIDWAAKYSTCLDLATAVSFSASPTWVPFGGTARLTAVVKTVDHDAYGRLGGNPLGARTVLVERRLPGATTWTAAGQMSATTTSGVYTFSVGAQTSSQDWRAVFPAPAGEGLRGSASGTVTIGVGACRTCPQSVEPDRLPGRLS
jgi:hypothetical protein